MINKNYISEKIQERFSDLLRIKFSINGNVISDFSEKTLYPFMIYQNTVDTLNRLITVYLPENSNAALLTPFISTVGVYRKALELEMGNQNYKNVVFPNQAKQVVHNGDICSIINIDYINRLFVLRDGKGTEHDVLFKSAYQLNWTVYPSSKDISKKIEEFSKIDKLGKKDIFTFPLVPKKEYFQGVLLFTNVSKFETLLRTIKISDSDIKEHLKILKASFNADGESIDFTRISFAETNNKPVSLIVARSDSFRAFNKIIEAGNGSLDHIKTIIIDDFDEIVLKAKKAGSIDADLEFLQSEYFDKLGNGTKDIKDIYLICSNRNIEVQEILKNKGIESFPWLLTPIEKLVIDDKQWIKPEIIISGICNKDFEEVLDRIYKLLSKWKDLASSNFCSGQVLLPIRNLYILKDKWISFYDPINFKKFLDEFETILAQLQSEWFSNGIDYGLIDETRLICKNVKERFYISLLEPDIKNLIESLDENASEVVIVTRNNDETDKQHITRYLSEINSKIDFVFKDKNEILLGSTSKEINPDLIVYLVWDKELFNSSFVNPLAIRQVYLISRTGCESLKRYSIYGKKQIMDIGNSENKYKLLNLEPYKENAVKEDELISLKFLHCKEEKTIIEQIDIIPEIEEFVHDIIKQHNTPDGNSNFVSNSVILFFEDGSHIEWPEHKNVFFYDENLESEGASIQKNINDLKVGDQIMVAKRSKELKKVIEDALAENESYSKSIIIDHDWRDKILNYINLNHWDLQHFRRKLNENGFKVDTDFTIINWIEGDTIKPQKFTKLLVALCQMGILNEEKLTEYYNKNKDLKSIKTKFIRSSVQKLILSLKGINYGTDALFDEHLLNAFIDHIEIKRVLGIFKK